MKNDFSAFRILVVTAEDAIATTIKTYLIEWGYHFVGIADCCLEAKRLYRQEQPDMVLIDIRLRKCGTGMDLAHFIRAQAKPGLFLYLGSQPTNREVRLIRETLPVGYLNKPLQPDLLYANLEIAFYKYTILEQPSLGISLSKGNVNYFLPFNNILYLEADHIYVKVYTTEGSTIVQRCSLSDLLRQLPDQQFVKTHRSFAINVTQLNSWDKQYVYLNGQAVPLSRGRRKAVMAMLEDAVERA